MTLEERAIAFIRKSRGDPRKFIDVADVVELLKQTIDGESAKYLRCVNEPIADAVAEARAMEREACAKVADGYATRGVLVQGGFTGRTPRPAAVSIAEDIRARKP